MIVSNLRILRVAALAAAFPGAVLADEAAATIPGHSAHGDAFDEGPRQQAYLMGGTGDVHFPVTTTQDGVQEFVNQGIGQLHAFWFYEAERSFRQAALIDPDCAMAYWGMAMANVLNEQRARGFIGEAVERMSHVTDREKLYIEGLRTYLRDDSTTQRRAEDYARVLDKILQRYPDDLDAKAFLATHFWRNQSTGLIGRGQIAGQWLLGQVLEKSPMHPAHHLYIHACDSPEYYHLAVESAGLCGPSAPNIAHMWHMPGHVYERLKRYNDLARQQEAAMRVDHKHLIRNRVLPDRFHLFVHNNEWLVRSWNKVGRVQEAIAVSKNMIEIPRHPKYNTLKQRGSFYYGRIRLLQTLENNEMWKELIELCNSSYLEPTLDVREQVRRLRCLGVAYFRGGDVTRGNEQLAILETLLERSVGEGQFQDSLNESSTQEALSNSESGHQEESVRLDRSVMELRGHGCVAKGDSKTGYRLLEESMADPFYLADAQLRAGDKDSALETARRWTVARPHEARPLAVLVYVAWQAGKRDEAAAAFETLREITGPLDLNAPVFARLAPIAAALKLAKDWRTPPKVYDDVGEFPRMDSLGPMHWHPRRAPNWSMIDVKGKVHRNEDFSGKPTLMIFFLGHGCLHCVEQLEVFGPMTWQFQESGIQVLAASSDGVRGLQQSVENYSGKIPMPLFSDSRLAAFKSFGAYDNFENVPLHGTFLIDKEGLVRWWDVSHEPFMDVGFLLSESKRLLAYESSLRRH